jgi:hypothetical protein
MGTEQSWQSESEAIVARIFQAAAGRAGGASALARHLRVPFVELRAYFTGEAMPPEEVLLRAVDLLVEDLGAIRSEFSEQAWRQLSLRGGPA